ncbi:MAG TPA: caspase family protein [bacterium]|nr:caspase family protein [bacterium]
MSERRYAVLIAASQFPSEPGLQALRCPEKDVDGLCAVLQSPQHGGFAETVVLKNVPHWEALLRINQQLKRAERDDFVLIFYSGHGKLDQAGRLHLATADTVIESLEATSIPVESIRNYVDVSHSNKVALILDCCFSGAAGGAFARGGVDDQLQRASGGRGTYLMTASTGVQVAMEKESDAYGVFTKHLIDGIESGGADLDGDGRITMDELYRYIHDRVLDEGSQEPMKWDLNVRGELVIANTGKSPKEERRRQLRETILQLAGQHLLPDRILRRSLEMLSPNPPVGPDALRQYDTLMDGLHQKKLLLGDFIERWYELDMVPHPPASGANMAHTPLPVIVSEPPAPNPVFVTSPESAVQQARPVSSVSDAGVSGAAPAPAKGVKTSTFCANCGARMDGKKFCTQCGTKLRSE